MHLPHLPGLGHDRYIDPIEVDMRQRDIAEDVGRGGFSRGDMVTWGVLATGAIGVGPLAWMTA
jgi:hypothetical protein